MCWKTKVRGMAPKLRLLRPNLTNLVSLVASDPLATPAVLTKICL